MIVEITKSTTPSKGGRDQFVLQSGFFEPARPYLRSKKIDKWKRGFCLIERPNIIRPLNVLDIEIKEFILGRLLLSSPYMDERSQ
jgi:hypothetical protein